MEWYKSIKKSELNPPSWVFSPVWTVLYIIIAYSFILYMKNKPTKLGIIAFIVHMITNLAWSPIFFVWQNPLGAFIDINLMIVTLIWVMHEFKKRSLNSTLLLIPYLAWVLFATFLNYEVVRLN